MKVKIMIILATTLIMVTMFTLFLINAKNTTTQQTVSQTAIEEKKEYINKENSPFCTVKEKEECQTNNTSDCCPFEID